MEDIAATAEDVIRSLVHKDKRGNNCIDVKTSQLRKFLTAVNTLSNKITVYRAQHKQTKQLSSELTSEIKYLKVKITYQIARGATRWGNPVEDFVHSAKLIQRIEDIGTDVVKYQEFAKFIEALVAYHKFYGGKD